MRIQSAGELDRHGAIAVVLQQIEARQCGILQARLLHLVVLALRAACFVIEQELDIELKRISLETVNERGTMILKYAVVKNTTTT